MWHFRCSPDFGWYSGYHQVFCGLKVFRDTGVAGSSGGQARLSFSGGQVSTDATATDPGELLDRWRWWMMMITMKTTTMMVIMAMTMWVPPCSYCFVCSGNLRSCQTALPTLPGDHTSWGFVTFWETSWHFVSLNDTLHRLMKLLIHDVNLCQLMTPYVPGGWSHPATCLYLWHLMTLCDTWWHSASLDDTFDISWHTLCQKKMTRQIPEGWEHPAPCWSGLPW